MTIACARCSAPLDADRRRAAISIMAYGDECIYTYFHCPACDHYTVECYHDRFIGDSSVHFLAPQPREVGERCVALVRACPAPHDKRCRCPSHEALFTGLPRS